MPIDQYNTQYLTFNLTVRGEHTSIYDVLSKSQGSLLGRVQWYAPWRQYCFFPSPNCVFNKTCMNDICGFIDTLMKDRREKII